MSHTYIYEFHNSDQSSAEVSHSRKQGVCFKHNLPIQISVRDAQKQALVAVWSMENVVHNSGVECN